MSEKVLFLDFDGVINSQALFKMQSRKTLDERNGMPVNQSLCPVLCSNLQYIIDKTPGLKIVISSTWREIFSLVWLQDKLKSMGVDSSVVIGVTPSMMSGRGFSRADRGEEIQDWLDKHPEFTTFVILDDNFIGGRMEERGKVVHTEWEIGLTLPLAREAIHILGGDANGNDLAR